MKTGTPTYIRSHGLLYSKFPPETRSSATAACAQPVTCAAASGGHYGDQSDDQQHGGARTTQAMGFGLPEAFRVPRLYVGFNDILIWAWYIEVEWRD